ncbi:GGDEF domain-containing protein [Kitasatospora indigofera]|uniref:GGDEF domain-containing protein n=1 Tax=Kitasatospora indigofera TaxID=67307 RepID=UPI0036C00214
MPDQHSAALIARARHQLDSHDLRQLRPLAAELLAGIEALAAGLDAARTDPVTGLPTRAAWTAAAEQLAATVPADLLLVDLDHFKEINDRHGHPAGDAVLAATGRRLAEWAGAVSAVARLGGDEFVALVPAVTDAPARVADLVRLLAEPVPWHGHLLRVGASVGAARLAPGVGALSGALAGADRSMYAAKGRGRRGLRRPTPAWLPRRRPPSGR